MNILKREKLNERWVMDALKQEKKSFSLQRFGSDNNWNMWYFKRQLFAIKRACSSSKLRMKIHLWLFEQKSLHRFILIFFRKSSLQLLTWNMILAECKQLLNFSFVSKSLNFFFYRCRVKNCKCIQNFLLI